MSDYLVPAPRLPCAESDAAWAALDRALLPPLWSLVAEYFDVCELWYLSWVPLFRLPASPDKSNLELSIHAIRHDHLPALKLVHDVLDRVYIGAINNILNADSVDILSWLFESNCCAVRRYYEGGSCLDSAVRGALRILMWEQKTGVRPWTERTASVLAEHGRFDALRALRAASPPCPWDARVYQYAARHGDVKTVEWLQPYFHDAPLPSIVCVTTVPMLKYFIDRGAAADLNFQTGLFMFGSVDQIRFLLDFRAGVVAAMDRKKIVAWAAGISCNPEKIELLLDRGFPLPPPDFECPSFSLACLRSHGWTG